MSTYTRYSVDVNKFETGDIVRILDGSYHSAIVDGLHNTRILEEIIKSHKWKVLFMADNLPTLDYKDDISYQHGKVLNNIALADMDDKNIIVFTHSNYLVSNTSEQSNICLNTDRNKVYIIMRNTNHNVVVKKHEIPILIQDLLVYLRDQK